MQTLPRLAVHVSRRNGSHVRACFKAPLSKPRTNMQGAGCLCVHASAPVRFLPALDSTCNYLLKEKRRAVFLPLYVLFTTSGYCLYPRHNGAFASFLKASSKHLRLQGSSNPAIFTVPPRATLQAPSAFQFCPALASSALGGVERPVSRTPCHSYALLSRRHLYWPPPREQRSRRIQLPSGKKCFVFNAKRDQDGKLEPVVCFVDSQDNLLVWLDKEEFLAFEALIPRLRSYYELWEAKAAQAEDELQQGAESCYSPGYD